MPMPWLVTSTRWTSAPALVMVIERVIIVVPGAAIVTRSGQTPQSFTGFDWIWTASAYMPAATATTPPETAWLIASLILVKGAAWVPLLVPVNDASTNCVFASIGIP